MRKTTWWVALTGAILSTTLALHAETIATALPYSLRDRASATLETVGGSTLLTTGYARVIPNVGNTTPSGLVILASRANGLLIDEVGAAGTTAVLSGRTYAELNGPVNTALAFANPNNFDVTIMFSLVNTDGQSMRQGSFTLAANGEIAAFLNEDPFQVPQPFVGAFSFAASGPVGVLALRSLVNENRELLMAQQPIPILISVPVGVVVIGHFADGGGWRTQVLLVNTTDAVISGSVQFISEGNSLVPAAPLTLTANGQVSSTFIYTIAPRASAQLETAGIGSSTQVGSVRITPFGSASPSAFAEYTMTTGGVTTAVASAPGQLPAASSRIIVESNGNIAEPLSTQTAVAITNTSTAAATATLELIDPAGVSTGFTAILSVPGLGHVSKFLNEIFPTAPTTIRGLLRVTAGSTPLSIVAMRTRYNEAGRFIATSIPVSNEALQASTTELLFPSISDGAGFTTQFILYSGITGQTTTGAVQFVSRTGQPLILIFR